MDTFLRELAAHGSADLNSLLATLNESGLCREVVRRWVSSGWIVVAPHSPLVALRGPSFRRDLTLSELCGSTPPKPAEASAITDPGAPNRETED